MDQYYMGGFITSESGLDFLPVQDKCWKGLPRPMLSGGNFPETPSGHASLVSPMRELA
jgi:hypothetical protein